MNYIFKRLVHAAFALYVTVTLTFVLIRLVPGGPVDYLMAQMIESGDVDRAREAAERIAEHMNLPLDQPMHVQYYEYMTSVFQGDLGRSFLLGDPVSEIMLGALPWTIFIMAAALISSYVLGIALGGLMAYWEGGKFDTGLTLTNVVLTSIPYYVFALIFLGAAGYHWGWFPTGGRWDPDTTPGFNVEFMIGAVYHGFLPFLSMQVAGFGGPALAMRGNCIQILGSDYLRVARLRGLPQHVITTDYVIKNGVLPLYTGFMISIASVFGGSVILEVIFSYRGIGFYMVRAFEARDYPLLMAAFIILATMTIIGVVIADLTYHKIDPRIDIEEEA